MFDTRDTTILKYYAYVATQAAWFVTPIWTLFLLANGLSYTQLAVLNATWWAAMVLGEIPTGYVGDRIGRRNSLLLGALTHVIAVLIFGQLSSFPAFLAIYAVWGIGITFRSGAESAWLYDTLEERTDEEEFTRIKGRGTAVRLGAGAVSAATGGYLAGIDLYAPFVASAAVMAVGVGVVLTIPKNRAYRAECRGPAGEVPDDCPDPDSFSPRDAIPVVRNTLTAPPLRSFVVAVAAFYALAWSVAVFTQPVAKDAMLSVGVRQGQVAPLMGWLYAGFTGVSALVTYHAERIEALVGPERWVRVAPAVLGVGFLVTAVAPVFAIPAFFLMRALLETTDVLKERYLNDHTESLGRTTVLSAASMLFGLARVPFRVFSGVMGDVFTPTGAMGIVGALLVGSTAVVVLLFGVGDAAETIAARDRGSGDASGAVAADD